MVETKSAREHRLAEERLARILGPIDIPCNEFLMDLDTIRHGGVGAIVAIGDLYPDRRTAADFEAELSYRGKKAVYPRD